MQIIDIYDQFKECGSVTTDTRTLKGGEMFFALKGENFDGNEYALKALEAGAAYAVVNASSEAAAAAAEGRLPADVAARLVVVEDTLKTLQELARWHRSMTFVDGKPLTVVALTGTNGKTTTKELIRAVLSVRYNVTATEGNLNNSIGVPLTLLKINSDTQIAVVEMGASHPGDIKELVDIAEPNCGLITNVGRAHLEGFGSFEGVQQTKKELYDYLREHQGFIFRNTDNPYLAQMAGDLKTVGYTTGQMPEGTNLVGAYNAENVSAAVCVGVHFGVAEEQALEAVRHYVPTNNRSQSMQTAHNHLIVDAYNANPTSMQAAINSFKGDTFILGAMRELGEYTHLEHQNIVNMLAERKADLVYLVGEEYRLTTSPYPIFDTVEDLHVFLQTNPLQGKYILLKGSRSTRMEKLLDIL